MLDRCKIFFDQKKLHCFLCFGIAILIAIQTIFNLGVNLGLLPTKGLTLPFVSYGGASLITFMAMIAIVLRIDYENRSY